MTDIMQFLATVNWPGALVVAGAFVFAGDIIRAVYCTPKANKCKECGERTPNPSCADCAAPRALGTTTSYHSKEDWS